MKKVQDNADELPIQDNFIIVKCHEQNRIPGLYLVNSQPDTLRVAKYKIFANLAEKRLWTKQLSITSEAYRLLKFY